MPASRVMGGWGSGAALAVALALGCTHVSVVPPTESVGQAGNDPCGALRRENERALATLDGAGGDPVAVAAFRGALGAAGRCTRTRRGAWAIVLGPLAASSDRLGGRWSLVHVDAAGGRASVFPDTNLAAGGGGDENAARGENLEWSAAAHVVPTAPLLFDYDGDGEPEAVAMVESEVTAESGTTFTVSRGRLWSAPAPGVSGEPRVILYEPARAFVAAEVRDVDGDGRPDIVSHGPYAALASVKCGSEDPYPVYGPRLLAHALTDGGFSWSDGLAATFARGACPTAPRAPLFTGERSRPDIVDMRATAMNLACARLWGAATEVLNVEIKSRCHPIDNCASCDDAAVLDHFATVPPPLRLSVQAAVR